MCQERWWSKSKETRLGCEVFPDFFHWFKGKNVVGAGCMLTSFSFSPNVFVYCNNFLFFYLFLFDFHWSLFLLDATRRDRVNCTSSRLPFWFYLFSPGSSGGWGGGTVSTGAGSSGGGTSHSSRMWWKGWCYSQTRVSTRALGVWEHVRGLAPFLGGHFSAAQPHWLLQVSGLAR